MHTHKKIAVQLCWVGTKNWHTSMHWKFEMTNSSQPFPLGSLSKRLWFLVLFPVRPLFSPLQFSSLLRSLAAWFRKLDFSLNGPNPQNIQWGSWNNSLNWRKVIKCINFIDKLDIWNISCSLDAFVPEFFGCYGNQNYFFKHLSLLEYQYFDKYYKETLLRFKLAKTFPQFVL